MKKLVVDCDERLVVVSPYLSKEVRAFLECFDFGNIKHIELITTFKPADPEQLTKPFQLRDFYNFFKEKYPRIGVTVNIDNHLHGKLYFSVGTKKELLLTSSNFTVNGFYSNNEWGVLIQNDDVIDKALKESFECISHRDVTWHQIDRACQFASVYLRDNPSWDIKPKVTSDILSAVYSDSDPQNSNPKYFLKPIGHTESPIKLIDKNDFSNLHQNLHFSKKAPKGIRKGDIVITTAVGAGSLLSYFRVTSGVQRVSESKIRSDAWAARWPWFLEGRNQSPNFGSRWWEYNLRRQDLVSEFSQTYPGEPVTYAGGSTLGTINRGNDKVRLTEKFAKFLISRIDNLEKHSA